MSELFLLSEAQMARISSHFPLAHGVPRVDDRRVVSGIIYVIRNGLQWKESPVINSQLVEITVFSAGVEVSSFARL